MWLCHHFMTIYTKLHAWHNRNPWFYSPVSQSLPIKSATHLPGASVEKVLPDTPGEICYLLPGDCFLFATAWCAHSWYHLLLVVFSTISTFAWLSWIIKNFSSVAPCIISFTHQTCRFTQWDLLQLLYSFVQEFSISGLMILKHERASEPLGKLVHTQITGP